jgi:hypothetical protein
MLIGLEFWVCVSKLIIFIELIDHRFLILLKLTLELNLVVFCFGIGIKSKILVTMIH